MAKLTERHARWEARKEYRYSTVELSSTFDTSSTLLETTITQAQRLRSYVR